MNKSKPVQYYIKIAEYLNRTWTESGRLPYITPYGATYTYITVVYSDQSFNHFAGFLYGRESDYRLGPMLNLREALIGAWDILDESDRTELMASVLGNETA